MKKSSYVFGILAVMMAAVPQVSFSQFGGFGGRSSVNRDSLNKVAAADYANMLQQIGVTNVRPGRDPNSTDKNRQPNYDELTANPYPFYPDALTTFDGKKVKTAKIWNKVRRPELVKAFEDEVYGRIPDNVPSVKWNIIKEEKSKIGDIPVVIRSLSGVVDNSSYPKISVEIQAQVVWPDNGKKNLPVILEFSMMMGDPTRSMGQGKSWQQQVIERGWAAAQIVPSSVQADAGYGLTRDRKSVV